MDNELKVTLIGTKLATVGNEFIFFGNGTEECENCKLRNSCMNLDKNKRYKIEEIRNDTIHDCSLHDSGVKAVAVKEAQIAVSLDQKKAYEGAKIGYNPLECDNLDCEFFNFCRPDGIVNNGSYVIQKQLSDIDCPKGYSLRIVEILKA